MRRLQRIRHQATTLLLFGLLIVGRAIPVQADTASVPSLTISQLKVTSSSGQFVTLYNTTDSALDMSRYQLEYFNNYDLSKATSSRLIALSGTLPPHSYYMVNDSALLLCYQLTINSQSLGFSSTAGMVEVLAFNQPVAGGPVTPALQDYVGWSKTAASGAQTLPVNTAAFLQRQPLDSISNPIVTSPGSGSWQSVQPDPAKPCGLITGSGTPSAVSTGMNQLLPASEPPATIVDAVDDGVVAPAAASLPAADVGLMAPQLTELLPNPTGTGNDAVDEYIELYNPNGVPFDLGGFSLVSGTTTTHSYTFSAGTLLPANGFTAYYADKTGLSLSNTSGQVKLADPFGNSIAASQLYTNAKDGQAWALASGKWYWTTKLTPSAANVITQPVSAKVAKAAAAKAVVSKSKTAATKLKTPKKTKGAKPASFAGTTDAPKTPIHPRTLALIGVIALLYGAYEYRADMANRIYQLKQYISARRANRRQT